MKKLAIPVVTLLLACLLPMGTAHAAASVSIAGSGNVVAGRTYTYTISVSANASSVGGTITVSGCATGSGNFWKDSASGLNEKITATANIEVKVNANAAVGDTAVITVSGEGSSVNADTKAVSTFAISGTRQITVVPAPTAPPPGEWEIAEGNVKKMSPGDEIELIITKADKTVPGSLLAALKDKGGSVNIRLEGYTCRISSADLSHIGQDVSGVDLSVTLDKREEVSSAAGGEDILQLHFNHGGPFPCKLVFTFPIPGTQPGDTVYIYYYLPASQLAEGKEKAVVAEDGTLSFAVWHASSYFVTDSILPGAVSNFSDPSLYDTQIQALNSQIAEKDARIAGLETSLTQAQDQVSALEAQNVRTPAPVSDHTVPIVRGLAVGLAVALGILCFLLGGGIVWLLMKSKPRAAPQ